eukprot:1137197-Pelagomonas_calceolata.AAC.1
MVVSTGVLRDMCGGFTETRDQFRISAKLDIITSSTKDEALQAVSAQHLAVTRNLVSRPVIARQQTWSRLKDAARQQFLWPHPAEPRQEAVDDSNIFCPEPPSPDSPVDTFCLVVVDVDQGVIKGLRYPVAAELGRRSVPSRAPQGRAPAPPIHTLCTHRIAIDY